MTTVKRTNVPQRPARAAARVHRLGAHLPIAGGMHKALVKALRLRCETVQVFVKNQRQWQAAAFRSDDLERWHELLRTPGFGPAVAHASYLINLATPDKTLFAKSVAAFAEELRRCGLLDIRYLVVHPGAAVGAPPEEAIRRIAVAVNRVLEATADLPTMILLETTAGQGSTLGHSFGQLGEIIRQVEEPQRVGVCVDTCHVFAAGYDIRTPAGYAEMIGSAERTIGVERIRCWHLNDSKGELSSRVDRHEHIGKGRIGSAGFRNVLSDSRFHGVPMILETPKGTNQAGRDWDRVNLARGRSIATRAVAPLSVDQV